MLSLTVICMDSRKTMVQTFPRQEGKHRNGSISLG